jgi:hypothetical protein
MSEPTDPDRDPAEDDPGANTEMFRAFVQGHEPGQQELPESTRTPFRMFTLLIGIVVFVALAWLLLRA